jgi:hypothetical protein
MPLQPACYDGEGELALLGEGLDGRAYKVCGFLLDDMARYCRLLWLLGDLFILFYV